MSFPFFTFDFQPVETLFGDARDATQPCQFLSVKSAAKKVLFVLISALCLQSSTLALELASPFTNHAVLQREKPIAVWGFADVGEKVTVTLNTGQATVTASTIANKDGHWSVTLPRQSAVSTPCTLTVQGTDKIELTDILIGEVWICGGQSNMELPVRKSNNPDEEIAAANHPLIRHIKIKRDHANASALPRLTTIIDGDGWTVCSPETVGDYTAVGYYFARTLQKEIKVPIGLINASWGGTKIETWMPAHSIDNDPKLEATRRMRKNDFETFPARQALYPEQLAAWEAARDKARENNKEFTKKPPAKPTTHRFVSHLYNGMIHPLVPYTVRGTIWYQGEDNSRKHTEYRNLFHALITSWREVFQQDFSFYWVQLASYKAGNSQRTQYAYLREAQDQTLDLPQTGEAVAIDIGEEEDIHPKNKQEVGRRLALIALNKDYSRPVNYEGPRFVKMTINRNTARIELKNAASLHTPGNAPVAALELAGEDKVFHPATVTIKGNELHAISPEVPKPIAARYAFRNYPKPEANLYNADKLPLYPFRTDDWPERPSTSSSQKP